MTKSKSKSVISNAEQQYPLLTTRLYIPPPRPNLVPRPHLIERLDEGMKGEFTLISAPAGFGKTTLLSEWIHQSEIPVAWVSLDKGDSDPVHFIRYVVAALQTIESSIGKAALTVLQTPQPPPVESVLTNLINEITTIPEEFALILDDYHLVESKQIHNMVEFLLDHLPPQMHLVTATRADPPLPLARLRGRNQLTELRASDLRFTSDETFEFLNKVMKLGLSSTDISRLESRTEGWIAGLQLAVISMQGRKDIPAFIKAFSGDDRYIVDYLAEEVLKRQPEHIRNFFLKTSILNRLTGSLCDAVTGQEKSQQMLDELEKANLFIISLDNKRSWYRYHHLFAELLQQRLRQTQGHVVPELHKLASEWFEQNKLGDDAIEHALAAEDFERAGRLIEELAEAVWLRSEDIKLLGWLEALPDELISSRPLLSIFYAWVLIQIGQQEVAEQSLDAVERELESTTNGVIGSLPGDQERHYDLAEVQGKLASVRAFMTFMQGRMPDTIRFSRQALDHLPEENLTWRCTAEILSGNAHFFSGDMAAAGEAYSEAVTLSKASGDIIILLIAKVFLTLVLKLQGQLQRAMTIGQELLPIVNRSGLSQTTTAGWLFAVWGEVLYERNDLDQAMHFVQKGVELNESEQVYDAAAFGVSNIAQVRVLFARGEVSGAKETIRKMEEMTRDLDVPPWIAAPVEAWKARIWLTEGNLDAAVNWAGERGLSIDDELSFLREVEHIMLVRILIAQNRIGEAKGLLGRLLKEAEKGGRIMSQIEIRLVQALALRTQGNTTEAVSTLKEALSLAEPGGHIRLFVDEGPAIAELLQKALDQKADVPRAYVKKLLLAFRLSKLLETGEGLVERLSDRELEVLGLIAAGLSSKKISEELFVSLSTVKTHISNIYSKLNVHSRVEAVTKAKDLGLL